MSVFTWHERGQRVELFTLPGIPGVILEARSDGRHGERIELPARACAELVEALGDHIEDPRRVEIEELLADLGGTEAERDRHRDRCAELEQLLAAALADVERLKSALDLADLRTRQLEDALDANDAAVIR